VHGRKQKVGYLGLFDKTFQQHEQCAYNISTGTLHIPGLKRYRYLYDNIFARITAPIQGGHVGDSAIVDETQKSTTIAWLQEQITQQAYIEIASKLQKTQIYFKDGVQIDFAPILETDHEKTVTLKEMAHISVLVFERTDFAQMLARMAQDAPRDGVPHIVSYDALSVQFNNADLKQKQDKMRIIVNGTVRIAWYVDKEALQKSLAGQRRVDLEKILVRYSSIDKATVINRPFWRSIFPSDIHAITVHIAQ